MAKLTLFGTAFLLIALAPSSSTLARDGFGNGGGHHGVATVITTV